MKVRKMIGVEVFSGLPVIMLDRPERYDRRWKEAVAAIFEYGEPVEPLFNDPDAVARAVGGIAAVDEHKLWLSDSVVELLKRHGLDRDYITQWSVLWDEEGTRGGIGGGISEVFVITDKGIEIFYRNF